MKKILFLATMIISTICLHSQNKQDKPYKAPIIGIKGGINHSAFKYNAPDLKSVPHSLYINPNAGIFCEFNLNDYFNIAAEFFMYNRGFLAKYVYENNYNVKYEVNSKYFTTRIPVYCHLKMINKESIKPFIMMAPSYNYLLGGDINLSQPGLSISNVNINIGQANMNQHDFSLFFGGGCKFYIHYSSFSIVTKLELGYNVGLTNSFSKMEIEENSISTNVNAYNITGKRRIDNVEFNISIGIPLKFTHDACYECNDKYRTYSKKRTKKVKRANTDQHRRFLNMPY